MRPLLVILLLALVPAAAPAAWTDGAPLSDGPAHRVAAAATGDGTTVSAWVTGSGVYAQVGAASPVRLSTEAGRLHVATGGGQTAVTSAHGVHFAGPDGVFSAGVPFPRGTPVALAANARGDMAVLLEEYYQPGGRRSDVYVPRVLTAYRPAGGAFGAPVEVGGSVAGGLVLTDAGQLIAGLDGGRVVTRSENGAVSTPVQLAQAQSAPELALAGSGRAVAAFRDSAGSLRVATGSAAGGWQTATVAVDAVDRFPVEEFTVDADEQGQALVAWLNLEPALYAREVDAATGAMGERRFIGRPSEGTPFDLGVAPDGSAGLAFLHDATREVRLVRRTGTGPFGAPEVAGCFGYVQAGLPAVASAQLALPSPSTVLFSARATGVLSVARAADTPPRVCRTPEDRAGIPQEPAFSADPVLAGRPVTIDVSFARAPDRRINHVFWKLGDEIRRTTGPALEHSFARPGRQLVEVWVSQAEEEPGVTDTDGTRQHTIPVTVYAPATLAAPVRQRPGAVARRGVRVRASAQVVEGRTPVMLIARRGERRLGNMPVTLGAASTKVRVPLHGAAKRMVRERRRTAIDVELRQDGAVLDRAQVVVERAGRP